MKLKGKVAIVTGAARGIGRATALKLASEGTAIIIGDIDERAEETVAEVEALGREALFIKTDVSRKDQVEDMVKGTLNRFGTVDILVNNAGIAQFNIEFEAVKEEDWEQMLNINLKGVFFCLQAVLPVMKSRKSGRIINVSSIAARTGGMKSGPHYAAAKAGVIALTKSAARSGAPYGINVNAVAPGLISTDMTRGIGYETSLVPLGWLGKPEEVAEVICFLASDASRYLTGDIINVDGGMLMN